MSLADEVRKLALRPDPDWRDLAIIAALIILVVALIGASL